MIQRSEKICPRCLVPALANWQELSDEQKMLVLRLPMSADYTAEARKKHRICTRCWFEDNGTVQADA